MQVAKCIKVLSPASLEPTEITEKALFPLPLIPLLSGTGIPAMERHSAAYAA